jgi:hypothetical protein
VLLLRCATVVFDHFEQWFLGLRRFDDIFGDLLCLASFFLRIIQSENGFFVTDDVTQLEFVADELFFPVSTVILSKISIRHWTHCVALQTLDRNRLSLFLWFFLYFYQTQRFFC